MISRPDQPFRELLAYLGGISLALGVLTLALAFGR